MMPLHLGMLGLLKTFALVFCTNVYFFPKLVNAIDFKPCLRNNSIARKLTDANGIVRPVRVGSGNWDAPIILARIAQILLNEVIGIEADFFNKFGGSTDLIKNITGCLNADCSQVEDYPYVQFDFENWFTVAGEKILAAQPQALVKGFIGYDGQEGLYMKKTIADAMWQKYKLPLVYFQSLYHPNRMWMEFFTKVSDISIPSGSGCRGATADSMKGVGLICDTDGWWYSPSCATAKNTCIPVLMGGVGWLGLETALVINYTSMPMAVSFLTWPDQRILNGSISALFFWWRPDWTYNSVGTVERFLFPKHDRAAWDKGIFETDFPDFQLKKYMAHQMTKLSYKASAMFDSFTLNWIQINELMDTMERRKAEVATNPDLKSTVACDWVKAHRHIWEDWIPDREPCKAGEGLNSDGKCVRCSPGTKSVLGVNSSELVCRQCTSGKFSNSQGGTSCEDCTPGKFGASPGLSECDRCDIKGYTPQPGYTACTPCGGLLVTEYPGAENASACACPAEHYRDKINRGDCNSCPEGMTCAWGSDARLGAPIYPMLKPLYWSSRGNPLSVYMCDNEFRCPGSEPGTCGSNLVGYSCAHCIEGWVFVGQACKECASVEKTQLIFPTVGIILLPLLVIVLYKCLADSYSRWGSWQNGFMSCGFILLNHYQVISMLTGVNMKMPDTIARYYKFWSFSSDFGSIFNPECAGYNFKKSLILKAIFPGVYLCIGLITWFCSRMHAYVRMEGNRAFNAVVSMLLTFFAGIVSLSLTLFICKGNPNGSSSLAADRSIICLEADWNDMLAVGLVAIALWCIGVGSVFTWAIVTQPLRMQDNAVQMRWKFLFIKFRADRFWWALAFLAKSVLLNVGLVVLKNGVSQIFWMMCILTFYAVMCMCFMPWRHMVVNLLDITTHMFLNLSGATLLCFAKDFVAESDRDALNTDLTRCAVSLSLLCFPIALASFASIFYDQNASSARAAKERSMDRIRTAFTSLTQAPDDLYRNLTNSLSEWDYWFMLQAANTIMFEYFAVKSRAGYTTVVLDEEEKQTRSSGALSTSSGRKDDVHESMRQIKGMVNSNDAWLCDALELAAAGRPVDIDKMRSPHSGDKASLLRDREDVLDVSDVPGEQMDTMHATHLRVIAVTPRAVPEGRMTLPRTPAQTPRGREVNTPVASPRAAATPRIDSQGATYAKGFDAIECNTPRSSRQVKI